MRHVIVNRGMAVGLLLPLGSIGVAQTLDYSTFWFGNSFSGIDRAWVQNGVDGMAVAPDGTVFVNSVWGEGGPRGRNLPR